MMLQYHHFDKIDSTNAYLQRKQSECDISNWVVSTDEQTAGKGMGSNRWESEVGKNLTFSLALDMSFLPVERQFLLSEAVPLGIIEVLEKVLSDSFEGAPYQALPSIDTLPPNASRNNINCRTRISTPSKSSEELHIKWPNDIYFSNCKLAGILINSTIKANIMGVSIIGIGLNVNQMQFNNWPTHPISLKMITGKDYDLPTLMKQIAEHILIKVKQLKSAPTIIEQEYLKRLFHYHTWANYEVGGQTLRLFMTGIDKFGRLLLIDEQQKQHCYEIKQIKFIL